MPNIRVGPIHAIFRSKAIGNRMEVRRAVLLLLAFRFIAPIGAAAEDAKLLIGKAAMGDWTSDAPGVRRKITVEDLPGPSSNILAINRARVVDRPPGAQLRVPPGFKIELYASGFRDPRFLLTAPNGDVF